MTGGELPEPLRADPDCGFLGAQVGEPLLGEAHPRGQLPQDVGVGSGRLDDDALVLQAPRAGGHPARGWAADVGVVGTAGGEAGRPPLDEHR